MRKKYQLVCQTCSQMFDDDGLLLECDGDHEVTLLTTEHTKRQFEVCEDAEGIYRYQNWLPIERTLPYTGRMITYRSELLCRLSKLPQLWIAFNGYWPEKGATLATATFKDLEALTVLARLPKRHSDTLVVSSAGNTAAAFAQACSRNQIPCLIILPESGLQRMQLTEPLASCVKIVVLTGFADYYDAIILANQIAQHPGFTLEGGVKNVARRAGLGTTLLNAVEAIGQLPGYYFQAIGSGAGGIAVHEMAKKLISDGRFGDIYPRLMLSQNVPFAPMYHSWKAGQRHLLPMQQDEGKQQIQQIAAQVLSNQRPPYAIRGGVYDVLIESQGEMSVAENNDVSRAMALFQEAEGIDIDPARGSCFRGSAQSSTGWAT